MLVLVAAYGVFEVDRGGFFLPYLALVPLAGTWLLRCLHGPLDLWLQNLEAARTKRELEAGGAASAADP